MSCRGSSCIVVRPRPVSTPFCTHVRLVSPRADSPLAAPSTEFRLDEFDHVTFRTVNAQLGDPYQTASQYQETAAGKGYKATQVIGTPDPVAKPGAAAKSFVGGGTPAAGSPYGGDLFSEIQRYAALAAEIERNESFEVVHAHAWINLPTDLAVAGIKAVPLE